MIILFQNILFSKEFQKSYTCCFWLLTKIKKGFGTSFWYAFSSDFSHKNALHLIHYQLTKFQYQTYFPSQHIKQDVILNSCIAKRWRHKCKSSSQETADWRKTSGRGKYKNLNNLRTKKRSFLDEIRNNKKYEQTKPTQILNIYLNFFKKTGFTPLHGKLWNK